MGLLAFDDFSERLAGAEQTGFHGLFAEAERRRDVDDRKPREVVKLDDRALIGGEGRDRSPERLGLERPFRSEAGIEGGERVGRGGLRGGAVEAKSFSHRAAASASDPVRGDGEEPGGEALAQAETRERSIGSEEYLLSGVLSLFLYAEPGTAKTLHAGAVLLDDAAEGLALSSQHSVDKEEIIEVCFRFHMSEYNAARRRGT